MLFKRLETFVRICELFVSVLSRRDSVKSLLRSTQGKDVANVVLQTKKLKSIIKSLTAKSCP